MNRQRIIMLRFLLAIYIYTLIKVILFKFHAIDLPYLIQQFQISWHDPGHIVMRMQQGNLIPFHEIRRTLHAMTDRGLVNLFGNIAIFMPFGVLLGLFGSLGSRRGITGMEVLKLSFALSLSLEVSQAVFSMGAFDVDDLILNTSGGLTGFILYTVCVKLLSLFMYPVERETSRYNVLERSPASIPHAGLQNE
ncbi:VanZ family protein [Paenibacillaceae bacterium]|nr:VanZ family protein [Paenibacillaceae bacterium]